MAEEIVKSEALPLSPEIIQSLVLNGDMSKLNQAQQLQYYSAMCQRIGVDPAAQPFGLIKLQGKLVLYANRSCAQQLNFLHKLSHSITAREVVNDIYVVQCRTSDGTGRFVDSLGAVDIAGKAGETLANLYMKSETKAKRRGTLDFCGLGITSVDEIDNIEKYTFVEGASVPILEKKSYPKKAIIENSEPLLYAGEDGELYVSEIEESTFNAKKKPNAPFQVYKIICSDGKTYNTTKKDKKDFAQKSLEETFPILIEYRTSEYGFALQEILEFTDSVSNTLDELESEHKAKIEKEIAEVFPK